MLVRVILAYFVTSFFCVIVLKRGVRQGLTTPIMCISHCTSCGIAVEGETCVKYAASLLRAVIHRSLKTTVHIVFDWLDVFMHL